MLVVLSIILLEDCSYPIFYPTFKRKLKICKKTGSLLIISTEVTFYDSSLLLRQAWDLFTERVLLKSSLKTGLLAPHQHNDLQQLHDTCGETIEPAMKLKNGTFSSIDKTTALSRTNAAHIRGTQWI